MPFPWAVAVPAALSIGKSLLGRKQKATVQRQPLYIPPPYQPSKYDAPSSEQLYGTYSSRARGEGVGYAPEDLSTMNAQAIDESKRMEAEVMRRGASGRARTGGLTTGGADTIRQNIMLAGGQARSKALRDIAIKNAVLKRRETSEGISGLYNFLGAERSEAHNKFADEIRRSSIINADITGGNVAADYTNRYNEAVRQENLNNIFDAADLFAGGYGDYGEESSGGWPSTGSDPMSQLGYYLAKALQGGSRKKRDYESYR